MGKRIVFRGGSGKVGRTVVPYLIGRGHKVLNLDLKPLDAPGVNTVLVDLADSGETFNALSIHFGFDDLRAGGGPAPLDAVVHFAAIPRILLRPDNAMFAANVLSTYDVVEAAVKLEVRKVVIASSITAYGVYFAEGAGTTPASPSTRTTTPIRRTATAFRSWLGKDRSIVRLRTAPTSTRSGSAS